VRHLVCCCASLLALACRAPTPAQPRAGLAPVARIDAQGAAIGLPAVSGDGATLALLVTSDEPGLTTDRVRFVALGAETGDEESLRMTTRATDGESDETPTVTPDAEGIAAANARLAGGAFRPLPAAEPTVGKPSVIDGVTVELAVVAGESADALTLTFTAQGAPVGELRRAGLGVAQVVIVRGARPFAYAAVTELDPNLMRQTTVWAAVPLALPTR
jgi:hypothetical protein